jgi:hypothetical protein
LTGLAWQGGFLGMVLSSKYPVALHEPAAWSAEPRYCLCLREETIRETETFSKIDTMAGVAAQKLDDIL